MDEINEGVGVTDSVPADATPETVLPPVSDEVQTVDADQTLSQVESNDEQLSDEQSGEIDKVLADAEAEAAKTNTPLVKHLRNLVEAKTREINKLSSNALTDAHREAVELYEGLTSFDNERGVPSAAPFAQKLTAKDPTLAFQVGIDIFNQPDPKNEGWTLGHSYLKANGIDPTRLDDVRSFLAGEQKLAYREIPEYVPPEFHEAFQSYSPQLRETLEFQLSDESEKQSALEILQDRQRILDGRKEREAAEQTKAQSLQREIYTAVEQDTISTYSKFVEDFHQSPTYTNVQVSGNPTVDKVIKSSINQMMLNLSEPESVAGQQALALFKDLGVNVNLQEVQQFIGIINGSIETSVKAAKGGYQTNKAQADASKQMALQRLSGIRNNVFTQAIKALAGQQQQQSEAHAATLTNNAGLPSFGSSSQIGSEGQKISTLDWIKQRANKP